MIIRDKVLGELELAICIEESAVDSYVSHGFSITLDRELTDKELEYIGKKYEGEIQMYSYENGSINHN